MFGHLSQILFGEEPELVIPIFGLSSLLPKLMRADSHLLFGRLPILNFNSNIDRSEMRKGTSQSSNAFFRHQAADRICVHCIESFDPARHLV
jgi:hypothetical protein